ncbi:MAG: hypothetical protein J6Y69_03705 [Treponema sp.]|nr:hypothetical protein [Treponema sp.]
MKRTRLILMALVSALMILGTPLFAEDDSEDESPFALKLTTDFAYYPKSDAIPGGTHFAPITGIYSGVEARTTLKASYKLGTPLGENWLVKDANVAFSGGLELSPVSIRPKLSIDFTPVPFLIFSAGTSIGWGWNIGSIEGLCELNPITYDYDKLSTFSHPYYDFWVGATFQFDTGAIIKGDWTHVVLLASYTATYSGIAGLDDYTVYEWQASKGKARGLSYEFQGVLGYQMPLPLNLAGLMFKTSGYYDGSVYGSFDDTYDGDFVEISISPLMRFKFGEKDELTCLFDFSSRRSFESEYNKPGESLALNVTGREWFFKRLALSWSHKFM